MDSIFQSPWVLIWASVVVWLAAAIVHITVPAQKRRWHMIAALVIFAAAFGIDYSVETDREKIDSLIDRGIEATVTANIEAIGAIIADDYADRVHRSKAEFMGKCKRSLKRAVAESIRPMYYNVSVYGTSAVVDMSAMVHLMPHNTQVPGVQIVPVKLKIECKRYSENEWKVSSADLVEINGTAVNWNGF